MQSAATELLCRPRDCSDPYNGIAALPPIIAGLGNPDEAIEAHAHFFVAPLRGKLVINGEARKAVIQVSHRRERVAVAIVLFDDAILSGSVDDTAVRHGDCLPFRWEE